MRVAAVVADGGLAFYRHRLPVRTLAGRGILFDELRGDQLPVTTDDTGLVTDVGPIEADVLVLQRPMGAIWRQVIPRIQANGTAVVVDVDDRFPNLHPANSAWKLVHPSQNPEHNYEHLAACCELADLVTVSTPPLVEVYGSHGRVRVLRNCVPGDFFELDVEPDDCFGWAGWVGSHPDDLRVLGGSVAQAVAQGRRFRVVGPDDDVAHQLGLAHVEATGWVDFDEYPAELARLGVALAPLTDTVFNRAGKSFLKPLEAMALGVPVICSDIPEYRLLTDAGAGIVADAPGDWSRALKLSENDRWRAEQRDAGRDVADAWRIERHVHLWAEAWQDAATIRRGRRPTTHTPTPGPDERTRGVVVFGMHRSGTSALASGLAALGLSPGVSEDLLPAADDNPLGFFELRDVNRLNDELLAAIGRSWIDPPDDPTVLSTAEFDIARRRVTSVLDEVLPRERWFLKDPRLTVLWPFWAPLFDSAPIGILIARAPGEVAESLHRRDGIDHEVGLALWEHYNRAALAAVRALDHRLIVTYGQLLEDPADVERRVRQALGAAELSVEGLSGAFAETVHGDLRRSVPDEELPLSATQAELWAKLQSLASTDPSEVTEAEVAVPTPGAVRRLLRTREPRLDTQPAPAAPRPVSDGAVDVSIIIPCFNKVEYTMRCLTSLAENTPDDCYEVVLVDNASADATPELCSQLDGDVIVIRNEVNLGFSKACNQGAAAARGRHLLFLNNDTEALPGWLEPMLAIIENEPDVGAVGSRLLFPDRTLQHAGVVMTEREREIPVAPVHDFYRFPAHHPPANVRRDLEVVTGACVLFRREAFEAGGGFDEGYWNGFEDVDLCLTVRRDGWRVVYEPASTLIHHESVSGPERFRMTDENIQRLQARWTGRVPLQWLDTSAGARRIHPAAASCEIRIAGPANDPAEVHRTATAARRACRGDDLVSIEPTLAARVTGLDGGVVVGSIADHVQYRLTVAPGVTFDRDCVDRLLGMAADDAAGRAGPVFLDGAGEQHPSAWLQEVPASATACRAQLKSHTNAWRRVASLDPRCILERLDRPDGGGVDIVIRSAVVADAPAFDVV